MSEKKKPATVPYTPRSAGKLGGEATKKKYGSEHYAEIGRKGGQSSQKIRRATELKTLRTLKDQVTVEPIK